MFKSFKYRVYPTRSQVVRLNEWENALRFLWNLANEQRLIGLSRTDKKYPSAFDQEKELTELRKELLWLNDVPRHLCGSVLDNLDKAWQKCFKRLARKPIFKKKNRNSISFCESDSHRWRLSRDRLRFPKLGKMPIKLSRPLEGKPKSCTIKKDGDQWFACVMCEVESPEPQKRTSPIVGIDRGITNVLADSDGRLVLNPKHFEKSMMRLARFQRAASKKKKRSQNRKKANQKVMRLHRKVRRQREHFLHVESSRYAKSHGVVVIEALNVKGMIQNRHLARSIASTGWGMFGEMLKYKLCWSGGKLVKMPPQFSSQTCSACGAIDKASRSGEAFGCTACGFAAHSDTNAAKVLKQRYEMHLKTPGSPWCTPVEEKLPESLRRSRKPKARPSLRDEKLSEVS